MNPIDRTKDPCYFELARMLEGYEYPAILVSVDYEILAFNELYQQMFGKVDLKSGVRRCYQVSHQYDRPCDQAGEDCPLKNVIQTQKKQRVLHIHQTLNGAEHIEIDILPIHNSQGDMSCFVELMKPVPLASGARGRRVMAGSSPVFKRMLERIAKVGRTDASVLLLGETGTGKELAARAIHESSLRKDKPLITLECSGLTDTLFESELFGHVKGAFTGANATKPGLVEMAHGGTLFLDEIADVPLTMQIKLLRLLENQTFRPVGSTEIKNSNFRLICATHKNIHKMIEHEAFRLDLFHRINVFPICLPSLKERLEDIPEIAKAILRQLEPEREFFLTESSVQLLAQQPLKGNIRELRNILNRAVVLAETNVIDTALMQACLENQECHSCDQPRDHSSMDVFEDLQSLETESWVDLKTLEAQYLKKMAKSLGYDRHKMAKILGISVRSLYRKMPSE